MDEAWTSIARSLRDIFPVKKKKKVKPFPLWIVFVVLGVLLFGVLLIFSSGREQVRVSHVVGMTIQDARDEVIAAGLNFSEQLRNHNA